MLIVFEIEQVLSKNAEISTAISTIFYL